MKLQEELDKVCSESGSLRQSLDTFRIRESKANALMKELASAVTTQKQDLQRQLRERDRLKRDNKVRGSDDRVSKWKLSILLLFDLELPDN
jgi:hypothetical protein